MNTLSESALVDLVFDVTWEKNDIVHNETYFARNLNCWRDILPAEMIEQVLNSSENRSIKFDILPGELLPEYRDDKVKKILKSKINTSNLNNDLTAGRFYPQGLLSSALSGIFKDNYIPFRCIEENEASITADLNHPMSGIPFTLYLTVKCRSSKSEERGGRCTDWINLVFSGPGMQTAFTGQPAQYLNGKSLERLNSSPDPDFYKTDRFVDHIDVKAQDNLARIYNKILKPEDKILDLMAGWKSHLPQHKKFLSVHGLGLNINELKANKQLTEYSVQDLNNISDLAFEDQAFDAAVCSLSVEYLTDPDPVFKEVARVLKPGGIFAVAFSNRWFEEKSIQIWKELHDFERMGLVTEFFLASKRYESISTTSIRGYPRPYDDKYALELMYSDPIYVVSGKSRAAV